MVILPPGKYTVDMRSRASASSGWSRPKKSVGAAMCTPMLSSPLARRSTENASSISVVSASSMENAPAGPSGRLRRRGDRGCGGKADALGEVLEGEAAQEVILGPREGAGVGEHALGRRAARVRGLVQRAPLEARLVGLEEQRVDVRTDLRGQGSGAELARPRIDALLLLALLLLSRERGLEVLLGRGLVAPAAALVEIHRVRVECQSHGGGLLRRGRAAEVVACQDVEGEFLGAADFPQETRIDGLGELLCLGHEARQRLAVEAQQHRARLHLGALAVRGFDLEGRARLREDGAHAERAVLLEEHLLHDDASRAPWPASPSAHSTSSGTCSGKEVSAWSPPRTTVWQAPA